MIWSNDNLAAEIANAMDAGTGWVQLPERVELTDTVDLRRNCGLTICGQGGTAMGFDNPFWGTRIVWHGPANVPVFRTVGVGNTFADFAIDFEYPALCGVHVVKGQGIASGKHLVSRCSFIGYQRDVAGIVCGETESNGHCDAMRVRDCIGVKLSALFSVRNNNSVGHVLSGNQTNWCASAFSFLAGGKASVFGHSAIGDWCVLELGQQGKNNNAFEVYGLSVDAQAGDQFVLVRSRLRQYIQNVTIAGHLSGSAQKTRAELLDMIGTDAGVDLTRLSGVKV